MRSEQVLFKKSLHKDQFSCLGGKFIPNAPMRVYTTIKIGGPAIGVYIPEGLTDLKMFLSVCNKNRISLLPIGSGSNIIVTDKGLNNIFLKLSTPCFTRISLRKNNITCGAGVTINNLSNFAEGHSLSGVEFLVGIPATVGGAVFQNAGVHSKDVSCILENIECLNLSGSTSTLSGKDIDFKYRHSGLKDTIILSAQFKLKRAKRALIRNNIKRYLERRLLTQDYTAPSAGCVFKNPDNAGISAGEMIDRCGLKGKKIGDVQISTKHANFILNKGRASAEDVLKLISFIKKRVKSAYGVTLEAEVEII